MMAALQREGKVRWVGVSNFGVDQLRQAQAIAPVASLQPPYSLVRREAEDEVLPICYHRHIGVIAYSPMASGLLTGAMTRERVAALPPDDWRRKSPDYQEPLLSRNLRLVRLLEAIGRPYGRPPAEVAVAWVLRHPAVTGAIVGARRPGQFKGVAGAAEFRLSPREIAEIEAFFRLEARRADEGSSPQVGSASLSEHHAVNLH